MIARYVVIVAFVALVVAFAFGLQNDPSRLPSTFLNKPAPEFDLPSLAVPNQRVSSETIAGKTVLVNVWATWCVPCREEMPLLQEEWEKHQEDNIEFIGIDVMDDKNLAAALVEEMGVTYTNLHDPSGKISNQYGVIALPATFFITKDGRVAVKNYGPFLGKEGKKKFRLYIEEISE